MKTKNNYSQHYYLLDSCAFCRFIENIMSFANISHDILSNIDSGYFYYIPQFCIAEVFNTFAKWRYAEKKIDNKSYNELCEFFKKLIKNRRAIYPYDLHRYHNLNCDKIYKLEHVTPHKEKETKLSTFDILIIAMTLELQIIHGTDNVTLLSCDKRVLNIAGLLNIKIELYQ